MSRFDDHPQVKLAPLTTELTEGSVVLYTMLWQRKSNVQSSPLCRRQQIRDPKQSGSLANSLVTGAAAAAALPA